MRSFYRAVQHGANRMARRGEIWYGPAIAQPGFVRRRPTQSKPAAAGGCEARSGGEQGVPWNHPYSGAGAHAGSSSPALDSGLPAWTTRSTPSYTVKLSVMTTVNTDDASSWTRLHLSTGGGCWQANTSIRSHISNTWSQVLCCLAGSAVGTCYAREGCGE